jgi:hypothetical protein
MAKSLRDIIGPRAGRKLGSGENSFLDLHPVKDNKDPVKQKQNPHKADNVKSDHPKSHGNTKPGESEEKYHEANESEEEDDSSILAEKTTDDSWWMSNKGAYNAFRTGMRDGRRSARSSNIKKIYGMYAKFYELGYGLGFSEKREGTARAFPGKGIK